MMARIRSRRLVASLAVVALALAACASEQGGAQDEGGAGGGGAAGGVDTPEITIAMITHEAPGDTFWDFVRQGAQNAAAKNNINLNYSNDPQSGNQANLVQNAIDQGVDGIAVTLAYPDAMQSGVQTALDAGIPVVAFNSGLDNWADMGVPMYFGQDENIAGRAGAERLNEEGAEHVLCVIQEQGQVALEARCAGVEENFDNETTLLYVQGTDMTSVQSSITSQLQQDPSIDTVMMLGAPFAMTALQSVEQAGSDATVVTFDTNDALLQAIADGEVPWAIDQQPFVQGYLAIDSLWLNVHYGRTIGGGENVLTGPAFIDETNIDAVIEGSGDAEGDADAEDDA
jgi:simple sugar transport system substrate-binding protein